MMWPVFQRVNWTTSKRLSRVKTYLKMLEIVIPRLNDIFENENEVYFQQDGAPSHFHVNGTNFLARTFNQKWIGRR